MENKTNGILVRTLLVVIGCSLVVNLLLAFLLLEWSLNSPAVPRHELERLHQGMAKEQVQALLGDPRHKTSDEATGSETWTYGHPWKWYSLTVRFSSRDELIEYVHDD